MTFDNIELNKSLVWITLINYGYVDYTKNFLLSVERAKINLQLVIYCIDKETYDEFKTNKNCICLMADFLKYIIPSDFKVWLNIDYKRICFSKLDVIMHTLKETLKHDVKAVGYIDTDIVLFSDPTTVVTDAMKVFKNINIFTQCDEYGQTCSNSINCRMFCAGILIFRNIPEIYNLLEYKDEDIYKYDSDQHFLVPKLRALKIDYFTINRKKFINGAYYPNIKSDKIKFSDDACLIHFNYMIGHEKKTAMKLQGLWYL